MKLLVCSAILCSSLNAMAATTFDADAIGQAPAGWTCGATGRGAPKWSVEVDPSAPNKGKVLRQSGTATFPWCVKTDAKLTDGWVEVKFKALACWRRPKIDPLVRVVPISK